MDHISFIILHYLDTITTEQCIVSIKESIGYSEYSIVVVDNHSPNNSGELLQKQYEQDEKVTVLLAEENLGFAKGNNLGYQYARDVLKASFMVITNNDTIFRQSDFVELLQHEYQKTSCAVLGPDLVTPSGIHQNPHRAHVLSKREVRKMLLNKWIFLQYFKLKKLLHLENKINVLEYLFDKKDKKTQSNILYQMPHENVVLQGACIIFTPEFVKKEEFAFSPETFMYGEEDLLSFYCIQKNYKILYSPVLKVEHINGETTKKAHKNTIDKNIFTYKYIVEGCKILLKKM
ncbi:glycosyltransferase [Parablautia sp. Marseille-Q6255]|uniref:glycosyltransferase n=1 Tax=Parablautia sp. Marseille-Q6255 TaxID=3039593 RepID=UPI0024BCB5DB|nr:glycosyltransferase [Parablautia sp. Marseille-Q6255]